MSKGIFLTIPETILKQLKKEKEKFAYSSLQEVIVNILREKFYFKPAEKIAEKRGRPKKIDELKVISRKKVFAKRGGYEINTPI